MVYEINRDLLESYKPKLVPGRKEEDAYSRTHGDKEKDNTVAGAVENIVIVENFLSEDDLRQYDQYVNTVEWTRGNFAFDSNIKHLTGDMAKLVKKSVDRALEIASYKYGFQLCVYGAYSNDDDRYGSFNRWEPGDSLKLHADSQHTSCSSALVGYIRHDLPPFLIMYSALIYLNDDYEGGELSFKLHDLELKPSRGSLVMFPGSCMYLHEVKEIQKGSRYTHNFFLSNANLTSIYLDMVKMIRQHSSKE